MADPVINPGTIYAKQHVVTASAAALPNQQFANGLIVKAKSTNVGKVFVGGSAVTTTDDGTGTGFALSAGESVSVGVLNSSAVYIIGTLNDVVYLLGN